MSTSAQRFEEIDQELASFGKSDEELTEVTARAVALARELGDGDGELAGLLDGAEEALAAAREAAKARAIEASRAAAPARPLPEVKKRAPKPRPDPAPLEAEATRVQLPPSEPLAPVSEREQALALDDEIDDVFGSEPPPLETSDIAGMSVDELFADAEPSASGDAQELSSLFDDEDDEDGAEALRLSDPDLKLADIEIDEGPTVNDSEAPPPAEAAPVAEEAAAAPKSALPPPPPQSAAPPPPPSSRPPVVDDFPMFGEEDDATQIVSADEIEVLSDDDFELLVDEDVLEFDEAEAAEAEAAEGEEAEGGLISRILGRK